MTVLKFTEWAPDLVPLDSLGLTEAKNVLPVDKTYKQFAALATTTGALNARCQGTIAALTSTGSVKQYAGTSSKLYDRTGTTYTDRSGTAYSTPSSGYWKFGVFGNRVIAVNGETANNPQTVLVTGTTFGDLAGSPPKARHVGVWGPFAVLGYTDDATSGPRQVRWCDIDTPTSWSTPGSVAAAAAQAGAESLNAAYGVITHIANGEEWGLAFQQRAITRFTYVGGNTVFTVNTFERERGAWYPNAVAQVGNLHYFVSFDGFYATDGVNVIPIGEGKVNRWFTSQVDSSYAERMTVAVDLVNKLIVWSFPGSGAVSGAPNTLLHYSITENRFTYAMQDCELVYSGKSAGYTLEDLDAISSSLDALALSLDYAGWQGGSPVLSGFYTDHKAGEFTGSAATALIDTAEANINRGGLATVTGIKPIVGGSAATTTVKLGTRSALSGAASYSSAVTPHARTGVANFRSTAWYHRARVEISGGFDYADGVEVDAVPAGMA